MCCGCVNSPPTSPTWAASRSVPRRSPSTWPASTSAPETPRRPTATYRARPPRGRPYGIRCGAWNSAVTCSPCGRTWPPERARRPRTPTSWSRPAPGCSASRNAPGTPTGSPGEGPLPRQLPHRVRHRVTVAVQGGVVDVGRGVARRVVAAVEGEPRGTAPLGRLRRRLDVVGPAEQPAHRHAGVLERRVVGTAVALGLDLGRDAEAGVVRLEGLLDRRVVVVDEIAGVRRADHVEVEIAADPRTVRGGQ